MGVVPFPWTVVPAQDTFPALVSAWLTGTPHRDRVPHPPWSDAEAEPAIRMSRVGEGGRGGGEGKPVHGPRFGFGGVAAVGQADTAPRKPGFPQRFPAIDPPRAPR